jgi:uncharacterized delta-60 repeat protein
MRAIAVPRTTRFIAAVLLAVVHCKGASALADGYYDTTWLGSGRITFQGDYVDPELLTGPWSELDVILPRSDGSILLAGALSGDSWAGAMSTDGSWISTFGVGGLGRTTLCHFGSCNAFVDATVQTDGSPIIVGASYTARFSSVGKAYTGVQEASSLTIDDQGGYVVLQGGVTVQPDGKILVAGAGFIKQADVQKFGIVRLKSDLSLDTTFNQASIAGVNYSGGAVVSLVDGEEESAEYVLVQPDGRIILVGWGIPAVDVRVLDMVRLNVDGSLDNSFGTGGKASFAWPTGGAISPGRPILDSVGRVLVPLGVLPTIGGEIISVARVTPAGQLDKNFGQQAGFATFSLTGSCPNTSATALALDSAGRIVVVGGCYFGSSYFIVIRLRGDTGYLDGSFGISGHGLGEFAAGTAHDAATSVAFDSSGRPLVGGYSGSLSGISRLSYDLIYTNNFEPAPRGCLPPNCD